MTSDFSFMAEDDVSSSSSSSEPSLDFDDPTIATRNSRRDREIRAAWRANWTGRRRIDTSFSRDGEKHPLYDFDTQFDLSPAAFYASSAPARTVTATRPKLEYEDDDDPLHWSPRGVEDDRNVVNSPSHHRDAMTRAAKRVEEWRERNDIYMRHSNTWPNALSNTRHEDLCDDEYPPLGIKTVHKIAGCFFPSCCDGRTGERGQPGD